MVTFIYVDETGSVGKGARRQPELSLMALLVPEDKVQVLGQRMQELTLEHLGWIPADFEFHGVELWQQMGHWSAKSYAECIAAYEAVIGLIPELDLGLAHASIHKARLNVKYSGRADKNAYLLALQFLLEKVNAYLRPNDLGIVVADEAKEERLRAVKLVSDLQDWGGGEVPGRKLNQIIDSLHYVESLNSPGVQMADLAVFARQRFHSRLDTHPDAQAGIRRIWSSAAPQMRTWRETWPAA